MFSDLDASLELMLAVIGGIALMVFLLVYMEDNLYRTDRIGLRQRLKALWRNAPGQSTTDTTANTQGGHGDQINTTSNGSDRHPPTD